MKLTTTTTDINGNPTIEVYLGWNRYVKASLTDANDAALTIDDIDKCSVSIYQYTGGSVLASPVPLLLNQTNNIGEFIFNITPAMTTLLGRGTFIIEIKYTENTLEIDGIKGGLIVE